MAQLLLDRKGRIVFVKCRPPETVRCQGKDLKWTEVIKGVEEAIDALAQVVGDQEKYRQKSRGNFPAVNFGYTMGPGDTVSDLQRSVCTSGLIRLRNLMNCARKLRR